MMIGDNEIVFPICPEGNHLARVFSVIDMGTESFNFNGKDIAQRKIRIAFELPEETYEFDLKGEKTIKNHIVGAKYTASKGKNSKLRPVLKALLGDIPQEEMDIFDILGKTCMVDVTHEVGKTTGREYAKVNAVTSTPKGVKVAKPINEPIMFTWDMFDKETFDKLPKWIKGDLQKTPEFQERFGDVVDLNQYPKGDINPDDIPF